MNPIFLRLALMAVMSPAPNEAGAGLSLDDAITLAVARNERVQIAAADLAVAQARVEKARAAFLPTLTLTSNYLRRSREIIRKIDDKELVLQTANALNAFLDASISVLEAQNIPLYQRAGEEMGASTLKAEEVKRQIGFEAARAFLSTLTAEHLRAAAEGRVAYAEKSLADAAARRQAQLVGSNDSTRAELELATARATLADAVGTVAERYVQLSFLLAEPVKAPLAQPDGLFEQARNSTPPLEGLIIAAQRRRLDMQAQTRLIYAARRAALAPPLRWIPTFTGTAQLRATNEVGLLGRPTDWYAGLNMRWPIYDAGVRTADEHEADALAERRSQEGLLLARSIAAEVEQATISLTTNQRSVVQAEVAATAAQRNAEEATALYHQGLANALTMADASARLYDSQAMLARARFDLVLAYLNLRSASGFDPFGQEPTR